MKIKLTANLRQLHAHRKYVYYAMAFGLSSLILPFGIQYLVNNLALSGMWFNTLSFLIVIGLGLFLAQLIRYSQLILGEALQREIFVRELARWEALENLDQVQYFFEVPALVKSFSKAYSHIIELCLLLVFGLSTLVLFHPAFLLLPVGIGGTLLQIYRTFPAAIKSSIQESNQKYRIYEELRSTAKISASNVDAYLRDRDLHFGFAKSAALRTGLLAGACQLLLLALGTYLIQIDQLSVGQLVSAEIIISGILVSLLKIPQTLEAVFDYETSEHKIAKATKRESP